MIVKMNLKQLGLFLVLGLAACKQEAKTSPETQTAEVMHTKIMEYAVDLNSVFHADLNDEDFSDVSPLTQNLIEDVLAGKLIAYDRFSDEVLTAEQVRSVLQFTDTIWFEEEETGDRHIEIVERNHMTEFYGFTFREKWSYNAVGSIIERKIVGLAPRIPVYSRAGGEFRGFTSAFWVKYD